MQAQSAVIASTVRDALAALPQAKCVRSEHMQSASRRLATVPVKERERAMDRLAGFGASEVDVLLTEARGLRHPIDTARGVTQSKLLQRAVDVSPVSAVQSMFAPVARALLAQGRVQLDEMLTQRARIARSPEATVLPWLRAESDLHFVRLGPDGQRVGIALVTVSTTDVDSETPVAQDARLALSLAAHACVVDGVLPELPTPLFVATLVVPQAESWAPLMLTNTAVAAAVQASAVQLARTPAAPARLVLRQVEFDPAVVRDALKVGEGVWERCVLQGAVPAPSAAADAAPAVDEATRARLTETATLAVAMRMSSDALAMRMALAQGVIERELATDGRRLAGPMDLGPATLRPMERLDLHRAVAELERRGIAALDYCRPVHDVEAMRDALEAAGIDTRSFVRAGSPDEARVRAHLGADVEAFVEQHIDFTLGRSAASLQIAEQVEAFAAEVAASVGEVAGERAAEFAAAAQVAPLRVAPARAG